MIGVKSGRTVFWAFCVIACALISNPLLGASWETALGDGVELSDFDYDLDSSFIKEMGSRLGCRRAARYAAFPTSGSLSETVRHLSDTKATGPNMSLYRKLKRELWDRRQIEDLCMSLGPTPVRTPTDGFSSLLSYVQEVGAEAYGLTFVSVGGLGSYLNGVRILSDSARQWKEFSSTLADPSRVRAWQWNCSRYTSDDFCAPELLESLKTLEIQDPRPRKQLFVFWGYSQGGNTILEALARSKDLRDKTLAVVTVASPLGGSVVAHSLVLLFDELIQYQKENPALFEEIRATIKNTLVLTGGGEVPGLFDALFTDIESIKRVYLALTPGLRKEYLSNVFRHYDFRRGTSEPIFVFHLAGILNVADMPGLPQFTLRNGSLAISESSTQSRQTFELLFLPFFGRYPVSDSCVALQHSVIPKFAVPMGLKTELVGTLNLDHASLGLSRVEPVNQREMPYEAITDAILATVARRMKGAH